MHVENWKLKLLEFLLHRKKKTLDRETTYGENLFFSERDILVRFLGENCQLVWDTSGMKKLKKKKKKL